MNSSSVSVVPIALSMDNLVLVGWINISTAPEFWVNRARAWEDLGATHSAVNTMRAGLESPEAHINAIRKFKEVMGN